MSDAYDPADDIADAATEALAARRASFPFDGRLHCSFCRKVLDEAEPDPPRTCGGDCDGHRCTTCDARLWDDDEADRGYCESCLEARGCVACGEIVGDEVDLDGDLVCRGCVSTRETVRPGDDDMLPDQQGPNDPCAPLDPYSWGVLG